MSCAAWWTSTRLQHRSPLATTRCQQVRLATLRLWLTFAGIWNLGENPTWLLLQVSNDDAIGVISLPGGIDVDFSSC
jgi:hypothetical protein